MSRESSPPNDTSSVAVLPFKTIGEGDGYFADGITEAITTELGRVGGLRVIASNTAFRYRDKTHFREIARDLGVGLVVRGSVQRAGETVRIDVSLINTGDETALWSERYSRKVTDVLAVQDDISRQIASTLSKTFGAGAGSKLPSPPPEVQKRMTHTCVVSGTSRDTPQESLDRQVVRVDPRPSRSSNGPWPMTVTSPWPVPRSPAGIRSGSSTMRPTLF
jgi:TolB-like protein